MKVRIDKARCIGCAVCENICPKGIRMINEKAVIIDENAGCLKDAADACPQKAIILNEEDYKQGRRMGKGKGIGAGRGRGLGIGPRDGRGGGRGGGGRRR